MCGLIFVRRTDGKTARKTVSKRYKFQKNRGEQGFGFVSLMHGEIKSIKRSETESEILSYLSKENSSEILFHHRMPTSTPNLPEMTHPIVVRNKQLSSVFYVIHNGVISNPDELKERHNKEGFEYTTDMLKKIHLVTKDQRYIEKETYYNDSESLAIELALYLSGKREVIDTKGSVAFICLEATRNGKVLKLHYGRNYGNPLYAVKSDIAWCLRSEVATGEGEMCSPNVIYTYDYRTKQTTEKNVEIGSYSSYTGYAGYGGYGGGHAGYNTSITWPDNDSRYASDEDEEELEQMWLLEQNLKALQGDIAETRKMVQDAGVGTNEHFEWGHHLSELLDEERNLKAKLREYEIA